MSQLLDSVAAIEQIHKLWQRGHEGHESNGILNQLKEYISIPNQSPAFDKEVLTNGHQDKALKLMADWARSMTPLVAGLEVQIVVEKNMTPVILCTIPPFAGHHEAAAVADAPTVLMYSHADKQPPMLPWGEGLGPWTPVVRDGKLYGRGGADDGYGIYAALSAIAVLQTQRVAHGRIVILVEFCEESGSRDLPHYLNVLSHLIGTPSLVVCLDSGCANYEQMWLTTSLRGMCVCDLTVKILHQGVHSGMASGIVPSSFRIVRELLDRIEDSKTGKLNDVFYAQIPEADQKFARATALAVGDVIVNKFPWVEGAGPLRQSEESHKFTVEELAQALLRATWSPTISYTGIEGVPAFVAAGNVLRPATSIKLSCRLPPTIDPSTIVAYLQKELTQDVPYGAQVTVEQDKGAPGWCAPTLAPWLNNALADASQSFYGKTFLCQGEGGSIPFMHMLGQRYPGTQFCVTGVLGPLSNAHGPDEFLHIDMAQKLTGCVSIILAATMRSCLADELSV